jgi:hypothetical protein
VLSLWLLSWSLWLSSACSCGLVDDSEVELQSQSQSQSVVAHRENGCNSSSVGACLEDRVYSYSYSYSYLCSYLYSYLYSRQKKPEVSTLMIFDDWGVLDSELETEWYCYCYCWNRWKPRHGAFASAFASAFP